MANPILAEEEATSFWKRGSGPFAFRVFRLKFVQFRRRFEFSC